MPQRLKFFALFVVLVLLVLSSLGWAAEYSKGDKEDNKDVTITTFGELRWRYENWNNFDFDGSASNWHLGRARVGVKAEVGENIWGVFQIQDSRYWGEELNLVPIYPYYRTYNGYFNDNIDFHQAFLKIESLWGSNFGLKIGRQELSYGDERLVGADDWNNIGQAFDGLKVMFKSDYFDFDVFYTQLSPFYPDFNINNPAVPLTIGGGANANFSGFYGTAKPIENLAWDGYVFLFYDGSFGPDEPWLWTLGTRAAGTFAENFDYTGEFAFQLGSSPFSFAADDDVSAFALALMAGYTFPVEVKPRIGATFGLATGDDDPVDGKTKTFFPLFPSAHAKWGAMDFQTWSNMMNLGLKGSLMPSEDLTLKAGFNFLWLNKEDGGWFLPYGFTGPTSGTSKNLGSELDLGFHYMYKDAVGFSAGYSHFFPGEALDDIGLDQAPDWIYISTKLGF